MFHHYITLDLNIKITVCSTVTSEDHKMLKYRHTSKTYRCHPNDRKVSSMWQKKTLHKICEQNEQSNSSQNFH